VGVVVLREEGGAAASHRAPVPLLPFPPSHLGLSLPLQAPVEGEVKEEVRAASPAPVPL